MSEAEDLAEIEQFYPGSRSWGSGRGTGRTSIANPTDVAVLASSIASGILH